MTHSVTLQVPDRLYRTLVEKASKRGKEIEDLAIERLSDEWPEDVIDPFARFIGAFNSGIGDVGANHDKYIGEAIYREMHSETE